MSHLPDRLDELQMGSVPAYEPTARYRSIIKRKRHCFVMACALRISLTDRFLSEPFIGIAQAPPTRPSRYPESIWTQSTKSGTMSF